MALTFAPSLALVRRVAVGDSDRASSADGVPQLAATAYNNLLAASWTVSNAEPTLPVHDNGQSANKTIPAGDAWKCSYGYDADARTERSAAGAVCYSWAIPADALDAENANGIAAISNISAVVVGDRYLDTGAHIAAVVTQSETPPPLHAFAASTAKTNALCATNDQLKPDGQTPLEPNKRTGIRTAAAIEPQGGIAMPQSATAAYLHVCLYLADYTTTRGAWVEGGAILAPETLTVTFSRDVDGFRHTPERILIAPRQGNGGALERDERCLVWKTCDSYPQLSALTNPAEYVETICNAVCTGALSKVSGCFASLDTPSVVAGHEFGLGCLAAADGDKREVRATLSRLILPTTNTNGRSITIAFPAHSGDFYADGLGRMRILIFDSEPQLDAPATFSGTADNCVAEESSTSNGDLTFLLTFRRNCTGYLAYILCLPLSVASGHAAGAAWGVLPESLYLT